MKLRLLPKTLLARGMLLVAVLLAVGQFASLQIFEYFEREPRAEATALQAVTVVNYTRASLIASPDTVVACFAPQISTNNYLDAGICFRESSTKQLVIFAYGGTSLFVDYE